MKLKTKKLQTLLNQVNTLIETAESMENQYAAELTAIHPKYTQSAVNLIHYMALRSHPVETLQEELRLMGLPDLSNAEAHVMKSLLSLKTVLNHLLGSLRHEHKKGSLSIKKSKKLLNANTRALFGNKSKKRRTRIMVTLPSTAADDNRLVNGLAAAGMNSARINCAHDDTETWQRMINHVHQASQSYHRKIKIMMDLGGPKLRTGAIQEGPQVIHIKPDKDPVGRVIHPARIWLAPEDVPPPSDDVQAIIPIDADWLHLVKRGNSLTFKDARGKKCILEIQQKQGKGRWAVCKSTAYITPGALFTLIKHKQKGDKIFELGALNALEQHLLLKTGDQLLLHRDSRPGEPARYSEEGELIQPAHIACTLPEIFQDVTPGEPILFDDGKVEGIIESASDESIEVRILHAKASGAKLKADKGINLPESNLSVSGLTAKDREDLNFVAQQADTVNLSFVNTPGDVQELMDVLDSCQSQIGIILKIETRKGFNNLPQILLRAMGRYPIGVMIARGDLAVETGWKNMATIQEEILRVCEAAHIPDVWATQVLESMVKKGTPTRAEITDAAAAQRAECVMLNKGVYIRKGIKLLDKILRKMQKYQKKKETVLGRLDEAQKLSLYQDYG